MKLKRVFLAAILCTTHLSTVHAWSLYDIWATIRSYFTTSQPVLPDVPGLTFDREYMTTEESGIKVEGVWADKQPETSISQGRYPFPQPHVHPWPTQAEFLQALELLSKDESTMRTRIKALIPHCLKPGTYEDIDVYLYKDPKTKNLIQWTGSFGSQYVQEFNVKPSKEFYLWVMNHPKVKQTLKKTEPLQQTAPSGTARSTPAAQEKAMCRAIAIGRHIAPDR